VAEREGVFGEPAAACSLAGLISDVRAGRIGPDDAVLLVITGAGLKDLAAVERATEPPPVASPADLAPLVDEWLGEGLGGDRMSSQRGDTRAR
jgi:threonine synthase